MVKASRRLAWIATAVSLLLAMLPGVLAVLRGKDASYDASLAVLTATLVAVIWYTQYTFESLEHSRTQQEAERQRARKTVATGLLEELKWLDGILGQIHMHGPYAFYDPLSHPMFEAALAQASLFAPSTMEALSAFHALLRDSRATMNEYRLRGDSMSAHLKNEYNRFSRAKAAFAVSAIPPLVDRLIEEGGTMSARRVDGGWDKPGVPPLPPSAFGPRYGE